MKKYFSLFLIFTIFAFCTGCSSDHEDSNEPPILNSFQLDGIRCPVSKAFTFYKYGIYRFATIVRNVTDSNEEEEAWNLVFDLDKDVIPDLQPGDNITQLMQYTEWSPVIYIDYGYDFSIEEGDAFVRNVSHNSEGTLYTIEYKGLKISRTYETEKEIYTIDGIITYLLAMQKESSH